MEPVSAPFKGDPVGFEPLKEPWSEYFLDDGKVLRIKLVLTKVVKRPEQLSPDGNPVYAVATSTVVQVFRSDELPKRTKEASL